MKKLLIFLLAFCSILASAEEEKVYEEFKSEFLEFKWRIVDENFEAIMSAKSEGWVSVGFDPTEKMKDADFIIGYVKDGKVFIGDHYGKGKVSHKPDTKLGGTNDILEYSGEEKDGVTTIKFKIALNSKDKFDAKLTEGKHKVILACGQKDNFKSYHKRKASTYIDIKYPKSEVTSK